MNVFFSIIIFLLSLLVFCVGTIFLSIYILKKYPESKITSFIKSHIIDDYDGDDF